MSWFLKITETATENNKNFAGETHIAIIGRRLKVVYCTGQQGADLFFEGDGYKTKCAKAYKSESDICSSCRFWKLDKVEWINVEHIGHGKDYEVIECNE